MSFPRQPAPTVCPACRYTDGGRWTVCWRCGYALWKDVPVAVAAVLIWPIFLLLHTGVIA